jgi:Uma2 family endonuclease
LQEYLLINLEHPGAELFRLDDSGHWVLYPYGLEEELELTSLSVSIPVAELFAELD